MISESRHIENEQQPARFDRTSIALFLSVLLIFIAARFWRLTASCLWFDEIFSVHAAKHSWSGLVKFVAADIIHPPLFYALLKVWIAIGGESLLWLRLFPVLISVATVLPFWLLCRELKLKPSETNFALLLMAASGFLIKYAQEVRMYSLLEFFSVFSIWLFIRFLKSESKSTKPLLLLALVNLFLVYTHYYGWMVIGIQGLVILIWQRKKLSRFLLSVAALMVAYSPWIYQVFVSREPGKGLAQNIGWIHRPGLFDVAQFFVLLGKPFLYSLSTADREYEWLSALLVLGLFGIPVILFLWKILGARSVAREHSREKHLIVFTFLPVILALVLSWVLPYPVWGTRHLIICATPFFIITALAIMRVRLYGVKVVAFLIIGCWFFLAGAISVIRPAPALTWCAWENLIQQTPPQAPSQPTEVYAFEDLVAYHLWFSATRKRQDNLNFTVIKGVPGLSEDPAFFLPRRFKAISVGDQERINGERFWIAFRAPRWDESRPPVSILKAGGYQSGPLLSSSAQGEQAFLVEFSRKPK